MTQSRLRELLDYDPTTGIFVRKVKSNKNTIIGSIAGGINISNGYAYIRVDKKRYRAHRLAWLYMFGVFPKNEIDHINHIKLDNRISNLREATSLDNSRNSSRRKSNTSGTTGVSWYSKTNKWVARIKINGKNIYLGYFKEKKDAIRARKIAENKYGFHKNHGKDIT